MLPHAHNPIKRKRGISPETGEKWGKLALTVPGILMLVGTSELALTIVDCLHGRVSARFDRRRTLASGRKVADIPVERGGSSGLLINAAYHVTTRLKALHAEAGHVFSLCAAHLGLQDDALWQTWDDHRSDADCAAKDALWWMRSATSSMEAVNGILRVAGWRPPKSLHQEIVQLAGRSVHEVAMAQKALHRMRHAVVLEFFDAWMVLDRNR